MPGPVRGTAGFVPPLATPVLLSDQTDPIYQHLWRLAQLLLPGVTLLFPRRRRHVTSHRSSSFTLLQSLAIEDSRDKPTYSVLLGQLFAFIGTNPDQAVRCSCVSNPSSCKNRSCLVCASHKNPIPNLPGVQQQLLAGCPDPLETWQHQETGAGAHEGAADGRRARRGRHPPGGSRDNGAPGRAKVGVFLHSSVLWALCKGINCFGQGKARSEWL